MAKLGANATHLVAASSEAVLLLYHLAEALEGAYDSAGNPWAGATVIGDAVDYIREHCTCPASQRETVRHQWPKPGTVYQRCRMCGRRRE